VNARNSKLSRFALLAVLLLSLGACSSIKTGQVGVKTANSGKVKECGVEPGLHWTGFGGMDTFTTRLQYSYMTADPKEGDRAEPDDVKVSSSESAGMSADIQIGYVQQNSVKAICRVYNELAKDDAQVKDNIIRPSVRAVAPSVFSQYSAKDAKTSKRTEIANKIRDALNERFKGEPYEGFVEVQSVQIGDVRLPTNIQTLVDDAIKAEADATTAELQRKAQLTRAETERQAAELHSQTQAIDAAAQANANRQLAASLTPDLANLKAIEACANALAQTKAQVASCGGGTGTNVLISPTK
jgi:regulator of protease activity HflC (stomatin/prohibitin superfamily)